MTDATTTLAPAPVARRSHATLGRLVRAELRWIYRRPRTLVVLGLLAAIPVIVGIALTFVGSAGPGGGGGDGASLLATAAGNALVLPIATLAMALNLLLPLSAAMSGSDALAGETAHGTLRGWLLAPVSRGRLLLVKSLGVATFALSAVLVMAATGVLTGFVLNGTDGLVTLSGSTLSLPAALLKVAIAAGWVALQLWAIGAVALAISAWTEHPMVVLASVLGGVIVFSVLQLLDALEWLHPFLLNDSWLALGDVLRDPMPTGGLAEGALRAACYIVIALSIAYAKLSTKDG
ncbi:ABC transporter permease [Prauserella cavernicola]|uniref:ABC transporter permease subunit n=1 Tax=Prauserella cavernicola TaxID=2800127 RepID=A0A934QP79_9PSEU|nr:ABC transporter permease subunit [Prauserella cavernicola]MBK1785677.1 ABC transporter permease subunit [Prauserella cavernicola]